jgi:hypothetical protein
MPLLTNMANAPAAEVVFLEFLIRWREINVGGDLGGRRQVGPPASPGLPQPSRSSPTSRSAPQGCEYSRGHRAMTSGRKDVK